MNFLSTSILSGISTLIKLASGLVINKVIAVYIGPAGVALIGQFQNFLGIVTTVGNGAINTGVTKYVAEYNKEEKRRNDVINAAILITLISSVIMGGIVFFGSTYISMWILKTDQYSLVFRVLGITLGFIGINSVLLSIINGMKKIKFYITINISSSTFSLIITSILTMKYQVFGALSAMVIVQSLILVITLPIALIKLKIKMKFKVTNKIYFRKLFAFSLMSIVSIIAVSLTQILIRNHLISTFSIKEAGYWQSVWMISTMYLMVLTTAFSTYYLPKLSELQKSDELRREILSGYKIILPFVLFTALIIYFSRDFIIIALFTSEFYEMRTLFAFQLIGDFFKMASWTLAFLMIAKAMTKTFIITEIVFSISFYILTITFTKHYDLVGVTYAYALNYLTYLLTMCVIFRNILAKKNKVL